MCAAFVRVVVEDGFTTSAAVFPVVDFLYGLYSTASDALNCHW